MSTTISEAMHDDHRHCDELFARAEERVAAGDFAGGTQAFTEFASALERHLKLEEEVLFPALEEKTGGPIGPTQMMRHEHEQMRQALASMREGLTAQNGQAFLGQSETMLILLQQHNFKEENILYPMMDRALGADAASYVAQVQART